MLLLSSNFRFLKISWSLIIADFYSTLVLLPLLLVLFALSVGEKKFMWTFKIFARHKFVFNKRDIFLNRKDDRK